MSMIADTTTGFWITDLAVVLCGDDKFVSVLHHVLIRALITNCTEHFRTVWIKFALEPTALFSWYEFQILFDVPARNNDDLVFPCLTRHSIEHVTRLGTFNVFFVLLFDLG